MIYHCMVYFDPKVVFNDSPESNTVLAEIGPRQVELKAKGQEVAAYPLNMPNTAISVQVRDGKTSTTDGPFMETKEVLGGLVVIEARDLNEAVQIAAQIPFAQLGYIEIRPEIDYSRPRPKL